MASAWPVCPNEGTPINSVRPVMPKARVSRRWVNQLWTAADNGAFVHKQAGSSREAAKSCRCLLGPESDLGGSRADIRVHPESGPNLAEPVSLASAISVFCFEMAWLGVVLPEGIIS